MLYLEYHPERKQRSFDAFMTSIDCVDDTTIVLSERQRAYFYFRINQWTFKNQATLDYVVWKTIMELYPDIDFKNTRYNLMMSPTRIMLTRHGGDIYKPMWNKDPDYWKHIKELLEGL